MTSNVLAAAAAALLLVACVGDRLPPSPAAAASAEEARAGERLRRHLATVPGVGGASVLVHLPPGDPFARAAAAPRPARAAIVITTAAGGDVGMIGDAAQAAAHAVLGPAAEVEVQLSAPPPPAPPMARLGPFRVAAASRGPLFATLAAALVVITGLAAALAWALYRRGTRPHQSSASTTRGS